MLVKINLLLLESFCDEKHWIWRKKLILLTEICWLTVIKLLIQKDLICWKNGKFYCWKNKFAAKLKSTLVEFKSVGFLNIVVIWSRRKLFHVHIADNYQDIDFSFYSLYNALESVNHHQIFLIKHSYGLRVSCLYITDIV